MALFTSHTHQQVWVGHHCERCFFGGLGTATDRCPILARALASDRKPVEWQRMPRAKEMAGTMKCNAETRRAPVKSKADKMFEDVPMFDVEPIEDVPYVPVEGWPDKPTKRGVDHQ